MIPSDTDRRAGKRYLTDEGEDSVVRRIRAQIPSKQEAERMMIALELGVHINTVRNIERRYARRQDGTPPSPPQSNDGA